MGSGAHHWPAGQRAEKDRLGRGRGGRVGGAPRGQQERAAPRPAGTPHAGRWGPLIARAVRTGARLRVTQHPRVARVSESVTRPAAELPGGWQLRVCALHPVGARSRPLCSSCPLPASLGKVRTAKREQLIRCRKLVCQGGGRGGWERKSPPLPELCLSRERPAESQPRGST